MYDTTEPSANPSVAFSFIAKTPAGTRELCGVAIVETAPDTFTVVASPPLPAPATHPVLAQLDGSGCPSLVISDGGPGALQRYPALRPGGLCVGQPLVSMPPIAGASTDVAVGRVRLDPPLAGLAPDALVTTSGVYGIGASAPTLYVADCALRAATTGDI